MQDKNDGNNIRCFLAVDLPNDIRNALDDYLNRLRPISRGVRWVRSSSIHITLKFLGEISIARVREVESVMSGINGKISPFVLSISGSGAFPDVHKPRVYWLGLRQDSKNSLFLLNQWIENQLAPKGFEKEKRRFSPHLTLGRVRQPENFKPIFDFLNESPFPEMKMHVDQIVFMRSVLKPEGAEYKPIRQFPL